MQVLSHMFSPLDDPSTFVSVTWAHRESSLANFSHLIVFLCHSAKQVSALLHYREGKLILITLKAKPNQKKKSLVNSCDSRGAQICSLFLGMTVCPILWIAER